METGAAGVIKTLVPVYCIGWNQVPPDHIRIYFLRLWVYMAMTEEYCLIECGAMLSGTYVPMFQRNLLPPSSGKGEQG
jgi:hypothetical protein